MLLYVRIITITVLQYISILSVSVYACVCLQTKRSREQAALKNAQILCEVGPLAVLPLIRAYSMASVCVSCVSCVSSKSVMEQYKGLSIHIHTYILSILASVVVHLRARFV